MAFLSIGPLSDGHVLVVPRQEINTWTDAPAELMQKLITVAQAVGKAQAEVFGSERAGLSIAGFEVDHLHLHVWSANSLEDFDFSRADTNPDPERMDMNAQKLHAGPRDAGYGEFVPAA